MAGVPRASGIPDYGPSGTINFDPEIYSGKLVEKFYKTTVFGEIASTDYEGEIAGFGAQVKIRTIPDVTVSDYVIGAGLSAQYPTNNSVTLAIDQAKSFAVALSTVDSRQSDLDLADIFANDGSIQLRIAADADMLVTIPADVSADNQGPSAGADSNDINLGDSTTPRQITAATVEAARLSKLPPVAPVMLRLTVLLSRYTSSSGAATLTVPLVLPLAMVMTLPPVMVTSTSPCAVAPRLAV